MADEYDALPDGQQEDDLPAWFWRDPGPTWPVLAIAANFGAALIVSASHLEAIGGLSRFGVAIWTLMTMLNLGALVLGAVIAQRPDRIAWLITVNFLWGIMVMGGYTGIPQALVLLEAIASLNHLSIVVVLLTVLPIMEIIIAGLAGPSGWSRLAGVPAALLVLLANAGWSAFFMPEPLFYPPVPAAGKYQPKPVVKIEALYAMQSELMAAQINTMAKEVPGTPELYSVLFAGTADWPVYLAEVNAVAAQLEADFAGKGRVIRLVNSEDAPERYPLANKQNLSEALKAVAERMGPEDVALLYVTAFGSEPNLGVFFWQAGLDMLTPGDLAAIIDGSGIRNTVIILSTCMAGPFVSPFEAPDRLIIATASPRHRSWGCGAGDTWTEFGRAYFADSLRGGRDFRGAYEKAIPLISEREAAAQEPPSNPRISVGTDIAPVLDALIAASSP